MYGFSSPALAFHPVAVFAGHDQCRPCDFRGKHVFPVIKDTIEEDML